MPKCTVNSIFIFFLIYKKRIKVMVILSDWRGLRVFCFFRIMHIKLLLLEQLCSDQYNTNKTVTETNWPIECFIYTPRAICTSRTSIEYLTLYCWVICKYELFCIQFGIIGNITQPPLNFTWMLITECKKLVKHPERDAYNEYLDKSYSVMQHENIWAVDVTLFSVMHIYDRENTTTAITLLLGFMNTSIVH